MSNEHHPAGGPEDLASEEQTSEDQVPQPATNPGMDNGTMTVKRVAEVIQCSPPTQPRTLGGWKSSWSISFTCLATRAIIDQWEEG